MFQNRNWTDQNRRTSAVVKIICPNLDSVLFSSKDLVKFFTFKKTHAVNDSSRRCCFRSYGTVFLMLFQYSLQSGNWAYFRDISLRLFHCKGRICICKQLFVDRNILDSDLSTSSDPLTYSYSDPLTYSYSDPLTYSYSDLLTYSEPFTKLFNVFNVTQ